MPIFFVLQIQQPVNIHPQQTRVPPPPPFSFFLCVYVLFLFLPKHSWLFVLFWGSGLVRGVLVEASVSRRVAPSEKTHQPRAGGTGRVVKGRHWIKLIGIVALIHGRLQFAQI